jgi:hypothetical protein
MEFSTIIALWALPWAIAVVVLVAAAPRLGRLEAASWLFVIGAFLMASEDAVLPFEFAIATPAMDTDGLRGLVRPHVIVHLLSAGAWTVAAAVLSGWIARTALRRGERWAWWALLVGFLIGAGTDLTAASLVFAHGAPLPVTATAGGFGWQPIAVYLAAWCAALAVAYPAVFRPARPVPATA